LIDDAEPEPAHQSIEVRPKKKKAPTPVKKADTQVKKSTKRAAPEKKTPPKKRQKKQATPSDLSDPSDDESVEESATSDFGESDISDEPKPSRKSKSKPKPRTPVKRRSKKAAKYVSDESESEEASEPSLDDEGEESDAASTPPKKTNKQVGDKRKSKETVESDEEPEAPQDGSEEEEDEAPKKKVTTPAKASTLKKKTPLKSAFTKPSEPDGKLGTNAAADSESEMSVVIDETPKPKRKRKTKSEALASKSSGSSKPAKAPKAVKPKKEPNPAKELTPIEAEIKALQSQLVKCGVRKIWGFELKQYGEDGKAKIRHLQGMLKDVGMTGRFSEQRAKEIKEARELKADLDAVMEGESKWGLESGRRNRGQRKSFKESSDEDEGEGSAEGKSMRTSEAPSRIARAKQELAFLGDDESDSE